jgi:4,5-DOPA dioxygenase extradiol
MYPSIFISHGAPNIILQDSKTKKSLKEFSKRIKKPKYIIIFSAHYTSKELKIINPNTNSLMYDFYGFEKELYSFQYNIKSDRDITLKILEHLKKNDIDISIDTNRDSYDHGVWTALYMLYEKLDIPVIQISVPLNFSNLELINLGEKLQVFKDEAIIISSGGITHNLRDIEPGSNIKKYAQDFNKHIVNIIADGKKQELLEITKDDLFYKNHPTNEHFLPLFIAFGSAKDKKGISINSEIVYSNISMESFVFDILNN